VTLSEVYSLTRTSDGQIIYFAVSDAQRHGLYRAPGHPEWREDERFLLEGQQSNPANRVLLREPLADIVEKIPTAQLLERLHA
jgi:crotonobetainyl-CoA:carnitine CoA-transferase CaiB-like acyl-CoA transferase